MAPNPFVTTAPTLVYDFSDPTSDWVKFPDDADSTLSLSSKTLAGANSLRVQYDPGSNTNVRINRDASYDLSGTGSNTDLIHFRVAFESGEIGTSLGEGTSIRVWFSTAANFTKYAWINAYAPVNRSAYRPEWITLSVRKSDFTYAGGFLDSDWDNPIVRLAINVYNNQTGLVDAANYYADCTLDAIFVGGSGKVPITFSFDDNDASLEQACDDLDDNGWKATLVSTKDYVGASGRQTLEQLKARDAAGHRVINHGTEHEALSSDSEAVVLAGITEGHEFFKAEFPNLLPYYAATRGEYNPNTLALVQSQGVIGHRAASDPVVNWDGAAGYSSLFDFTESPAMRWEAGCFELSVADVVTGTAVLMIAEIDKAVANNLAVHIYMHRQLVSATGTDAERSDWLAVLAHIKGLETAGTVLPMAWHEWANILTGYVENGISTTHTSNIATGNAN